MASHHEFIGHYQLQILKKCFFCYFMFKFVNDMVILMQTLTVRLTLHQVQS